MNNMRKLINLMEGVMAVPGVGPNPGGSDESDMQTSGTIGRNQAYGEFDAAQGQATEEGIVLSEPDLDDLDEKSSSEKQARFMAACAHGADYKSCPPDKVSKEFNKADKGTEQLSKAMAKESAMNEEPESPAQVVSCNQDNPENAAKACAMEGVMMEESPHYNQLYHRFSELLDSWVEPEDAFDIIGREMGEMGIEGEEYDGIMNSLENTFFPDNDMDDSMDGDFDSAMASAGHGSDEDYGGDDFPMEDLQNGYNDVEFASGNDFFPNGADSPVVTSVGPSGARQGDNPEQKKMQVAEVHKELVYGYREFLKESASSVQKKKLSESAQVSDLTMEDWAGDDYVGSNEATFDGSFSMSGKALGRDGIMHDVGFDVSVKAAAGVGWEEDEEPTGWNYKTDNPTYTSHIYAKVGDVSILSVEFADGMEFIVDNDSLYLKDAMKLFGSDVLNQLLNPATYEKLVGTLFDKRAENIDPPEQDYHEPESYDSRY